MQEEITPGEEHVAFYYELGMALSDWAMVEAALFRLVSNCVPETDRQMLLNGFFAIENFRSKLEFASALITKKFENNSDIQELESLVSRLNGCASNRNQLAHRVAFIEASNKPGNRYLLTLWPTDKSKRSKKVKGLNVRDIMRIRYDFFSINIDLEIFSAKLLNKKSDFSVIDPQAMNALSLRQIASNMHELLGHPTKTPGQIRRDQEGNS